MTEVTLTIDLNPKPEERKRIFAIKNEKGEYLKKGGTYWTTDLNKCLPELRTEETQIRTAKAMLKMRAEYDSGKSQCFNKELYYGFERLFIQEVNVSEVK